MYVLVARFQFKQCILQENILKDFFLSFGFSINSAYTLSLSLNKNQTFIIFLCFIFALSTTHKTLRENANKKNENLEIKTHNMSDIPKDSVQESFSSLKKISSALIIVRTVQLGFQLLISFQ